jgi:hypothetical protein
LVSEEEEEEKPDKSKSRMEAHPSKEVQGKWEHK